MGVDIAPDRDALRTPRQRLTPSTYWVAGFVAVALLIGAVNYYVFVVLREQIIAKEEQQLSRLVGSTAASVENVLNVTQNS